jgi:hypothetical protein
MTTQIRPERTQAAEDLEGDRRAEAMEDLSRELRKG